MTQNATVSTLKCELNNETRLSIEPNYFVPSEDTVYLDNLYRSYNPCDRKPCKNNGFCITMNSYPGYDCNCKDGYFGPNCETHRCYVNRPLGMSNGEITDNQISASSYASGYPPYKARLGGTSCWRSANNTLGEFLEINFGRKRHVRQLKIEKDPQEENWTENFYLECYSGSVWSNLSGPYQGVKEGQTATYNPLDKRKIDKICKLWKVTWHGE
ncbi:coagulation factor VIII-like [Montipora foliosa]|uniref:coagulation factor VIII-like n=1 Tax=Montipora foliosa TaxID=591990 RepID=UPI0035F19847